MILYYESLTYIFKNIKIKFISKLYNKILPKDFKIK